MYKDINVAVGGPVNADYPKVYKTKFLKPGIPFGLQVTDTNTKYVIKYNFDLGGESVTIPEGCLIEFDGGLLSNGTIVGQGTIMIYHQEIDDILKNIILSGTFTIASSIDTLPPQEGKSGKFLTTDGEDAYWEDIPEQVTVDQTYDATSQNPQSGIAVAEGLENKQDVIEDLADIRDGAGAGATAYQKPGTGIPKTDMSDDVQASLEKANTAIQEHQDISGKADKSTTLAGYGIADAYTKTETYNKTEVNELVSTPHQNYVTVATKEDLDDIVTGGTASDDTIYRVSSYDFTANGGAGDVDVTKYSEYAYNGTVMVPLTVKSQVNEVFDISEYHSGAKYVNLEAALGVGGENVPASVKRGGMIVKFIDRDNDKYVQFRLTLSSFTNAQFVDTKNWQGVDITPTYRSHNLVESGGVLDKILEICDYSAILSSNEGNIFKELAGCAGDTISYRIENKSDEDGYWFLYLRNKYGQNTNSTTSQLIQGKSVLEGSFVAGMDFSSFKLVNTNDRNLTIILVNERGKNSELMKSTEDSSNVLNGIVLKKQTTTENLTLTTGYDVQLKKDMSYTLKVTNESNSDGYFSVFIYNEYGGTQIQPLNLGLITAHGEVERTITPSWDASYIVFENTNKKGATYEITKKAHSTDDRILSGLVAYGIKDFSSSTTNCSVAISDTGFIITKERNKYVQCLLLSNIPVSVDDFIFMRIKIKTNKSQWMIIGNYSVGADQKRDTFYLEANKEREICFRGAPASVDGTLNLLFEISTAWNLEDAVIDISDLEVYINGYSDVNFGKLDYSANNKTFIVDKDGGGHFYSIANAVNYIKRSFDVVNESYTIFVKNGVYDKERQNYTQNNTPYVIDKGSNRINIIGESRENTIIRWVNTAEVECKVIEVGSSACTIANLTIENIKGSGYNTSAGNNPYCLHIDLGGDMDVWGKYVTEIYNCHLYNECNAPIGAGLTKNQTISVHDCYIETNLLVGSALGNLYIHAKANGDASFDNTMSVDIQNNILVNRSGGRALTLLDVYQSTFATILCNIIGNLLYSSNPNNVVDPDVATRYNMVPYCMGNNVEVLNKINY